MSRTLTLICLTAALSACSNAPQGNVGFTASKDTIAIDDAVGRAASERTTRDAARAQCAAMGKRAHYVESQANLATSANEHLYLCW